MIRAAIRAAVPKDLYDQAIRAAADALLEAWPGDEPQSRLAADLVSCAVSLRQHARDLLWADGHSRPAGDPDGQRPFRRGAAGGRAGGGGRVLPPVGPRRPRQRARARSPGRHRGQDLARPGPGGRRPSPSTSGFSPTRKEHSARTIRTRSRPAAASPPPTSRPAGWVRRRSSTRRPAAVVPFVCVMAAGVVIAYIGYGHFVTNLSNSSTCCWSFSFRGPR